MILLLSAIAAAAFWAIPTLRIALQPLYYLNTHIHELAHAIAGLLTGGFPNRILVNADGSGITQVRGGHPVVIASAGYVGTAVVGSIMIAFSTTPERAALNLRIMGGSLLLALILLVRGDLAGIISGLAWVVVLFAAPALIKGEKIQFLAQFIGMQLCLTVVQAFVLLAGSMGYGVTSDATILESGTGVPAIVWVLGWAIISGAALWTSLNQAWQGPPTPRQTNRWP